MDFLKNQCASFEKPVTSRTSKIKSLKLMDGNSTKIKSKDVISFEPYMERNTALRKSLAPPQQQQLLFEYLE